MTMTTTVHARESVRVGTRTDDDDDLCFYRLDAQDGTEVHFKVRPTTKFAKVFEAYCQRKSLQQNAVRFLVDGERIRADQTPEDFDMEDGDCVDAMMEQVGGR